MKRDIIIIGGGPCGIALSILLSENPTNKILLIEKNEKLGGCWKVLWHKNKYFMEHSPRVLTNGYKSFFNLCKKIGYEPEMETVYGSHLSTLYKMNSFITSKLSLNDYKSAANFFLFGDTESWLKSNKTVQDWINHLGLSKSGQKIIRILSILIATVPENLLYKDFISSGGDISENFIQFKYPEKWIINAERFLIKKTNVKIIKNTNVNELICQNNKIKGVVANNRFYNCTECLLAIPPNAIYEIFSKSCERVRNNWIRWDIFKVWCLTSYYGSIGFQLHFDKEVPYPKDWCWSCANDWNIIILETSRFMKNFSKDPKIKSVWSCTIVDFNARSSKLKKSVNECDMNEIIQDSLRQINETSGKKITPYKITVTPGLTKKIINGKIVWYSEDAGFSAGPLNRIKTKGKIDNLYSVGSHSLKSNQITTLDSAVKSAYKFVDSF
jgi:hypothetical protein